MDHTINGVAFRVVGLRSLIKGARHANACELTAPAPWAQVRAIAGLKVPGLGPILDVGAPRIGDGTLPAGTPFNLITAVAS